MSQRRERNDRPRVPARASLASRYRYSKRRYRVLFGLLDAVGTAVTAFTRPARGPARSTEPRSILVIQLDHVGDAVMTTPMLRALRRRFPDAAIDVLASGSNHDVFENSPHVRQVYVSRRNWHARRRTDRSYFREVFRLARAVRSRSYDLAIDPRGDFFVTLLMWLAGIPRRIGWGCGGGGFLLTDQVAWQPLRHEVASRMALIEPLGVSASSSAPELFPSWADRYAVREMLAGLPGPHSPLVAVHVSAGTAAKRWPVAFLAEFVDRLLRQMPGTVVLVGETRDRRRSRQLALDDRRLVDWTGRLNLMQLAAMLDEADLFVGADSGPAHVAAAMGTPCVVLFSGTNRSACWRPIGASVRVLDSPVPCSPCHLKECPIPGHPCMAGITPWQVLDAVREFVPVEPDRAKRAPTQAARRAESE